MLRSVRLLMLGLVPWSDQDIASLRDYYAHHTNLELAQLLGGRHSVADVASKASRLGLKKTPEQLRRGAQAGLKKPKPG